MFEIPGYPDWAARKPWYATVYKLIEANPTFTCGVEVGVWKGGLAYMLLTSFPRLTHYTMVDSWLMHYQINGLGEKVTDTGVVMYGPGYEQAKVDDARNYAYWVAGQFPGRLSILEGPSVDMAAKVERRSQDFVLIDAGHTYEWAMDDIEAWMPKVRKGGLVIGDDFDFPGVERAVLETFGVGGFKLENQTWWVRV